jgi:hypothetical protein
MEEDPTRRGWLCGLAILLFACAIGLWRLPFGLDLGLAFTDERLVWGRYLADFVPLRIPRSFDRPPGGGAFLYPTLVGYIAGLLTWITHKLGWIENPSIDVFPAFLVARMMTTGFAVATVAVVGVLGRSIDSVRAGVFSAALMAVVPVCVIQAHYVSTDPAQCFFMTLALLLSVVLMREGGAWLAFLAGATVGLAFAAKYTGLLAGVPVAWAVLERAMIGPRPAVRTFLPLAIAALAGCLGAAVLACPLCFLRGADVLGVLGFYSGLTSYENLLFWRVELVPALGWYGRPFLYQLVAALPFCLGIGIYLASLAGILRALARRDAGHRLLLVTVVVYLVFASLSRSLLPRYLIPILPPLVVLAGGALAAVRAPRVRQVLCAGIWVYTAAIAVTQVGRLSYDQQMAASEWLRRDATRDWTWKAGPEPQPTIAVPQTMWSYVGLVRPFYLAGVKPTLVDPGQWLRDRPDYVVVPDLVADWIRTRPEAELLREDLRALESGDAGYEPVAQWSSRYFSDGLYTALDPVFSADYPQGEIGFTIYSRRGAAESGERPAS